MRDGICITVKLPVAAVKYLTWQGTAMRRTVRDTMANSTGNLNLAEQRRRRHMNWPENRIPAFPDANGYIDSGD